MIHEEYLKDIEKLHLFAKPEFSGVKAFCTAWVSLVSTSTKWR